MILDKQSFDSSFEVFLADTLESKQIHYQLRYQVYCDEMGFEDKTQFPEQMEYDEWDDHSIHFLVRHKASGHWLGGLRLVSHRDQTLPFENSANLYQKILPVERQAAAEMSRLCVIKEARRFSSKRFAPYGIPEQEISKENDKVRSLYNFKNHTRSLMWGLFRAAAEYSSKQNLQYWYFLVAPALACFIRREGFEMRQVGDVCQHRGLRTPYQISVENILANPLWLKDYKQHYSLYSDLERKQQQVSYFYPAKIASNFWKIMPTWP